LILQYLNEKYNLHGEESDGSESGKSISVDGNSYNIGYVDGEQQGLYTGIEKSNSEDKKEIDF
jgi:hypothetical protein